MKNAKKEWIKAYQQVLDEYKSNTHKCDSTLCPKCLLICKRLHEDCGKCPESVFDTDGMGCLNRKYDAANSNHITDYHKDGLIKYHEGAILFLKNMKRFSMKSFRNELARLGLRD